MRHRPNLGRLAGCCHPAPLHAAIRSLRAPPIASAGPFGTCSHAPERTAASWSYSSSHNPLGYCLGAWPETGHGPDSARTRFLFRASPHSSNFAELGTVAIPPRGTGDICLACGSRRAGDGRTSCDRPFPGCPGLSQSRLRRCFHPAALSTVLSRNGEKMRRVAAKVYRLFPPRYSPRVLVNNLGSTLS